MVEEIFKTYSGNQEELSYEEWKRWFTTLQGVEEVLQSGLIPAATKTEPKQR